jgi:hypothetical protein
MSWTIACAMQQLLIVMLIFQQLLLGVHSQNNHAIRQNSSLTSPTESKLFMIHFHYSFAIFVSVRESMR